MSRVIGLSAGAGLVAFSLWFANLGETNNRLSAQAESSGSGTRFTPRTRRTLAPAPADSRSVLERRSTQSDRNGIARELLREAKRHASEGRTAMARRSAARAAAVPGTTWGPDELSPEQFIENLGRTAVVPADYVAGREPEASTFGNTPRGVQPDEAPVRFVDTKLLEESDATIAFAEDVPSKVTPASAETPAADEDGSLERARDLLKEAHAAIARDDLAAARAKVIAASKIDVEYGLFDDRPELVLAEIDRLERSSPLPRVTPRGGERFTEFDPVAVTQSTIEPVEPSETPEPAAVSAPAASGKTAQELLAEARADIAANRPEQARAKAMQARKMSAVYGLFDDRPELVIAEIDRVTGDTMLAERPGSNPFAATGGDTPTETPRPNPQTTDATAVKQLLTAARADMKRGDFAAARAKAERARGANVVYGLFDERPETVLADIAGAEAAANIARNDANRNTTPTASADRERAIKLMRAARADMKAGDFEAARAKALAAQRLDVSYDVFDDRPEMLLTDLDRVARRPATNVAAAPGAANPAVTRKEEALALLEQSREAMSDGRYDEARDLARKAEGMKAAYGLFDDRPELVMVDLNRAVAAANIARNTEPPTRKNPFENPATTVEPDNGGIEVVDSQADRNRAMQLVAEARKALADGDVATAAARATEAKNIDVVYGVFDETPDDVLAEVAEAAAARNTDNIATTTPPRGGATPVEATFPPGRGMEIEPAVGTSEPNPFQPGGPVARADRTPSPGYNVIHPEASTARAMYARGLQHVREGNTDAAYEAFVEAYRSGERLEPKQMQQLQDFLRELNPRRRQGVIRLTQGERVETIGPNELDPEAGAGPIDDAVKKQAIEFERLRTVVLNAVFKAERMKDENPDAGLDILDNALQEVNASSLDKATLAPMVASLTRTRGAVESWKKTREPIIAQKLRNREVLNTIKRERETAVRIEQEFADLVEEFNTLMRERRFAEASVIAAQARELDPDNPVGEGMFWKSRFALRHQRREDIEEEREKGYVEMQNDIFRAAVPTVGDLHPMDFGDKKRWAEVVNPRKDKYGVDVRTRSPQEKKIEKSLGEDISLHFDNQPLSVVVRHLAETADINMVLDPLGLEEAVVDTNTPITIHVDGVRRESALKLILEPLDLGYMIQHDVLRITSHMRQQGKLIVTTYPVADLVVPIPNFKPTNAFNQPDQSSQFGAFSAGGQYSVPSGMGPQPAGQAFFQVGDPLGGGGRGGIPGATSGQTTSGRPDVDFDSLIDLIISTVEPNTWAEVAGAGSIRQNENTLSLVIRQTQAVHEEIGDLLEQLRRLQDLQVTVEIRFITIADQFFERIGVDFDFDIQDTVGDLAGTPQFGTTTQQAQFAQQGNQGGGNQGNQGNVGVGGIGGGLAGGQAGGIGGNQGQGQAGAQAGQLGAGGVNNFFDPGPARTLPERDNWPKTGTVVGLANPGQFTTDLDVGFRQGSFQIGVPDFGGFNPDAGIQFGMAILSDIEAFLFIQAAQGDERSNIMFAPKVTLFNGQTATLSSNVQRPFVTSVAPTVGVFAVGFTPTITVLSEGVTVTVQAVISADRRFVRLTVAPNFNTITDVFAFSFQGGGGGGGIGGGGLGGIGGGGLGGIGGGGLAGLGGGGLGGGGLAGLGGGGLGGLVGGGGGLGGLVGLGGIGGLGGIAGGGGGGLGGGGLGGQGGIGGQGGQAGQAGAGGAAGTVTIQQPVFEVVNVTTTVSVPDGGTVLLGGVKRLREGRTMAGVPILNKIPYVSRLFKNTGVGRDTVSLMLMVTPRIIIQEEEEELLGIDL